MTIDPSITDTADILYSEAHAILHTTPQTGVVLALRGLRGVETDAGIMIPFVTVIATNHLLFKGIG